MRYLRCLISKPSLFNNRTLEFSDSLTVVTGRNGSGKTFLARSLVDGIWKIFSGKGYLRDEAWQDMYLDISFAVPHPLVVVESFRVKYQAGDFSLIGETDREELLFSGKAGDEILPAMVADQLGKNGRGENLVRFFTSNGIGIFNSSSCVPSPSDIDNELSLDYSTIKDIILRDSSGFYAVHNYLKEKYTQGSVEDNVLYREIDEYEKKLKSLSKEIELIEIKNLRSSKLMKERSVIEEEIGQLQQSLDKNREKKRIIEDIRINIRKVDELNGELDSIKAVVEDEQKKIEKVSELENEIHIKFSQFRELGIADEFNLDRIQEVFREIIDLNERIDKFFTGRDEKRKKLKKLVTMVLVATATAAGYILYQDRPDFMKHRIPLSIIGGFALFFTPSVFLYSYFSTRVKKLEALNAQKVELEERLKKLLMESSLRLDNYRLSELYELLLQYFEDYIEYNEHQKELKELKGGLKDKKDLKDIHRNLVTLKKREEDIKAEISASIASLALDDEITLDPAGIETILETIDVEIEDIINQIGNKEQVLNRIDEEIIADPGQMDNSAELAGERDTVRKVLSRLQGRKRAMLYIAGVLDEAVLKREKDQLKKLIDSTLGIFHNLTGNQFIARINDTVVKDYITGNGLLHELNPAIIHTLLLSLKFSFTDFLVDSGVSLPLIIDEPFLFMDDERISQLKEQIAAVARKRQVIVFTHKKQGDDWGKLIEL